MLKHFLPSSQPNSVNFLPTQHHCHTGWRWRRPMAFRHSLARCRFGSHWIRQPHLGCPGWRPRLPRPPQKRSDSFQDPEETTVFIPKHISYNIYIYIFNVSFNILQSILGDWTTNDHSAVVIWTIKHSPIPAQEYWLVNIWISLQSLLNQVV